MKNSTLRPTVGMLALLSLLVALGGCENAPSDAIAGTGGTSAAPGAEKTLGTGGTDAEPEEGVSPDASTERSATELVASWDLGWNLGNSLDAPEGETSWGNPAVNSALFQAVADAGFDVVRVPVTWSLHTGAEPAFEVDSTWMSRVEEVVGYALDANLYVIINVHHDGADEYDGVEWLTLNDDAGATTEANNALVRDRFVKLWTQISSRFADYGERVLFESLNEIHDGYGEPQAAYHTIINDLNQAFVDTVRASGGNNSTRHLVVPGYNTHIEHTVAGFQEPVDTVAERLILSVHYYDPYTFAIAAETNTWGASSPTPDDWGQENHVRAQFDLLKTTYVDQGLPVILGEYGAVHQAGFEEYRRYYMEYVTKAAVDRTILPVYWDNGGTNSGEDGFGLFDRTTGAITHPGIVDAMMRSATGTGTLEQIVPPTP